MLENNLENIQNNENIDNNDWTTIILTFIESFESAMCDDMNTPKAIAILFQLINKIEKNINNNNLQPKHAKLLLETILKIDIIFGFIYEVPMSYFNNNNDGNMSNSNNSSNKIYEDKSLLENEIPIEINELIIKRSKLKSLKQFTEADIIRQELLLSGYLIKDKSNGLSEVYLKS